MGSVLSLDLATRKTGYCAGDGETTPVAGAWLFDQVGADYGRLGGALWFNLDSMALRFPDLALVVVEAPILTKKDKLDTVRKLYGISFVVETWVHLYSKRRVLEGGDPLLIREAGLKQIKRELAGHAGAEKSEMVAAAEKCGVVLPATNAAGREDAADAFGGWLMGLRAVNREASGRWDRRLWSTRHGLV